MTATARLRSLTADLGGPTHYLDFGGAAGAPLVVGVHGLGGAAWNWAAVAPMLTDRCRLLALDLAGHGLTPAAGRSTTVRANRRLLDRFLREVAREPAVVVGNSMGGLITALEAAAAPELVRAAVLVDAALPRPLLSRLDARVAFQFAVMALPGIGEVALTRRARRHSPEQQVRETLALCTVDPSRIPADVIAQGIEVATARSRDTASTGEFLVAARSLIRVLARSAAIRGRLARIQAPVLVLHGERDRLVPLHVAQATCRAFPDWELRVATDVGHVPMLEVPEWTSEQILDWLPAAL